jgi:hypothetical protein
MKTFVIASLLLGGALSHSAYADHKLINSDRSELSALCIAAAQSSVRAAAAAQRIPTADLGNIRCNGLPLHRFAVKYRTARQTGAVATTTPTGYVILKEGQSVATQGR